MNITFLIGNGFDINLGLDTRYTDFLESYLVDDPRDSTEIKAFKGDIRKQEAESTQGAERPWSNAELAFGRYTDDMVKQGKTADSFSMRRIDFCRKLARYLQEQEARIVIEGREQSFVDAIQKFRSGLSESQNEDVGKASTAFIGGYVFNFVIFNYTGIIDQFTLIRENRWFYDDEKKEQFLAYADGDNSALKSRIHIMDTDIFAAFTNIASESGDVSSETESATVLPLTS